MMAFRPESFVSAESVEAESTEVSADDPLAVCRVSAVICAVVGRRGVARIRRRRVGR